MGTEIPIDILNPSDDTKEAVNYLDNSGNVSTSEWGIPATVQGVVGGNSVNTKLLIYNEIADSSNGQVVPVAITNTGGDLVTLDGSSNLVFNQNSQLEAGQVLLQDSFALGQAFYIDAWINVSLDQVFNCVFSGNTVARSDLLGIRIGTGGTVNMYNGDLGVTEGAELAPSGSFTQGTWAHLRVEKWYDGGDTKQSVYVNGFVTDTRTVTDNGLYDEGNFSIGWSEDGGRRLNGLMNKIRINKGQGTMGVSFTPVARLTPYEADSAAWDTTITEQTTPEIDTKLFGRNVSNEPIEISRKNANKSIVSDFGNVSGSISPDFTSAEELTMATTAAVTDLGGMTGLGINEAGILTINNSGGYAVDTNSISILTAVDTGIYNKAFVNRAGIYYYIDVGGEEKEI